ncbi:MAG: hypothetical protein RMK94_02140 [Armatimonadota bacterium]|nr:hypothetical protein [Armatimonadota bacterium]
MARQFNLRLKFAHHIGLKLFRNSSQTKAKEYRGTEIFVLCYELLWQVRG